MEFLNKEKFNDINIVLIGFMGTGKTTVGIQLSKILGRQWYDTDMLIEEFDGREIVKIFEESGEEYFRELERKIVKDISSHKNIILSCGGGIVLDDNNLLLLKRNGFIILLTATPEEIFYRVKNNQKRPLLKNNKMTLQNIKDILEKRREKYFKFTDKVIDTTGKTVEEIIWEIIGE